MSVKITRTIHHGDYRNVATGAGETLWDAIVALPITTYDTRTDAVIVGKMGEAWAIGDGTHEWGWCDYQIEEVEA